MKPKVLFLCTHNSARSQMAEAFVKKYAGDRIEAKSAGLEPGRLNVFAKRVMEEAGCDMSGHYAKDVKEFLSTEHFGYVITVCAQAEERCPIFPGAAIRLHWPLEDPAAFEGTEEARLAKFREIRDLIDARVKEWLDEIGLSA
ncbi:MAG: arsenate reductase ArsC [Desulfomonile sp.]|nr:arsenate reductase ArsC [Desulfomonile sp.]